MAFTHNKMIYGCLKNRFCVKSIELSKIEFYGNIQEF